MKRYCLIDDATKEIVADMFDRKSNDIANYLGMSQNSINNAACNYALVGKKYRVILSEEYEFPEDDVPKETYEMWDKITNMFRSKVTWKHIHHIGTGGRIDGR